MQLSPEKEIQYTDDASQGVEGKLHELAGYAFNASEDRYKNLIENLPVIVYELDQNGNYVSLNRAFELLTGWSRADFIGEHFSKIVHPDDLKLATETFQRALQGEKLPTYELRNLTKSGEYLTWEFISMPNFQQGTSAGELGIAHDITYRKLAEDRLKKSMENFRNLFFNNPIPMWILDFETLDFLEVNDAAISTYGYSRAEFLQMNIAHMTPHEKFPELSTDNKKKNATQYFSGEWKHRLKNGKIINVELALHTLEFENSKALLIASFDITHRNVMEDAIKKSENKYRTLVDNALIGVYKTTLDGAPLYANEALAGILEFESAEEITNQGVTARYNNLEDRITFMEKIKREGKVRNFEAELLTKSANIKNVLISAILEGDVLSGMMMDITKQKHAEEELKKNIEKMQKVMENIIYSISRIVETRDPYTAGHQTRVASLVVAISKELNLSDNQIKGLQMAALIHDVGKIYIPSEILAKPVKLNEIEFALIKLHSGFGYEILKPIEFPWPVAEIVYQHHERLNGSGYPQALKKECILLESKILAVADVMEAMSSHRPYRSARSLEATLEELTQNKGTLYEPMAVDACIKLFKEKQFIFS